MRASRPLAYDPNDQEHDSEGEKEVEKSGRETEDDCDDHNGETQCEVRCGTVSELLRECPSEAAVRQADLRRRRCVNAARPFPDESK